VEYEAELILSTLLESHAGATAELVAMDAGDCTTGKSAGGNLRTSGGIGLDSSPIVAAVPMRIGFNGINGQVPDTTVARPTWPEAGEAPCLPRPAS
jgi:hypothetical protein